MYEHIYIERNMLSCSHFCFIMWGRGTSPTNPKATRDKAKRNLCNEHPIHGNTASEIPASRNANVSNPRRKAED